MPGVVNSAATETSRARAFSRRALLTAGACIFAPLLVLCTIHLDADHYGPSTDELEYHQSSDLIADFAAQLVDHGLAAVTEENLRAHFRWNTATICHPTFSRILSAVSWRILRGAGVADSIFGHRFHLALSYAFLGAVMACAALRRFGVLAAVVTALCYLGSIRFFGHSHLATTDAILAATWFYSTLAWTVDDRRARHSVLCGIAIGLAVATKLTAAPLAIALVGVDFAVRGRAALWRTLVAAPVALAVFVLVNPIMWLHPVSEAAFDLQRLFGRAEHEVIPSFIAGKMYGFDVPWWAHFFVFSVVTPIPVLLLGGAGFGLSVYRCTSAIIARRSLTVRGRADIVWIAATLLPFVAMMLPRAPNHDLERLFLAALPLWAMWAGPAASWLASRAFPSASQRQLAAASIVGLAFIPSIELLGSHPHESAYFNPLLGGARGAWEHGTDTFLFGAELTDRVGKELNAELRPGATVGAAYLRKFLKMWQARGVLRRDVDIVDRGDADYLLVYVRPSVLIPFERDLLQHAVPHASWEVDGAPFLVLFRRLH